MIKRKRQLLSITIIVLLFINFSKCDKNEKLLQNIEWWEASQYFTSILNNGLLAKSFQEKMNENFDWSTHEIDMITVLDKRQARVDGLFKETIQGLKKLRDSIVVNFNDFISSTPERHCCYINEVSQIDSGCFYGKGREHQSLSANPPEKVIKQMQDINAVYNVESMYYLSFNDGGMYEYPQKRLHISQERCLNYNPHTRPWYELASTPIARDIVLLVESENVPERDKLLAFSTATAIIETLGQDDRIAVFKDDYPITNINNARHVEFGVWVIGTGRNKYKLKSLLEDTIYSQRSSTNSTLGSGRPKESEREFESSKRAPLIIQRNAETVFVQITNSSETSCSESPPWTRSNAFNPKVIIAYIIGNKTLVPCLNYSKRQHLISINNTQDLHNPKNKFSNFFKWSTYLNDSRFNLNPENDIRITLPFKSYFDRGMIITLTLPIVIDGRFMGVVANDIRNWISLDHISGQEVTPDSYGFLIDQEGRTLFHPLLPSPYYCIKETCTDSPTFDLISNLEQADEVQEILQSMINMKRNIKVVEEGVYIQSTGHSSMHESNPVAVVKRKLVYAWIPLATMKLSLCTVIPLHNDHNDKVYSVEYKCTKSENCKFNFQYHLETRNPKSENCSYFGGDVIKDEGLVKFSPWAFQNPIGYLNHQNSSTDPYMRSIKKGKKYEDLYTLLKGANLKSSILLTETAKQLWKTTGPLQCFIGIRYIGTVDGVFQSYPGIALNATYDHRNRPWYQVAMANRKPYPSISLTFPYKDYFSGGEIISLVTSVNKELNGWSTSTAVLGGDFSLDFLTHHLNNRITKCDGTTVECFFIDNMGYIILHMSNDKLNKHHLTEIYPYIARVLIQNQALMRDGCHDYEKDTVFLYWFFKMPFFESSAFYGKGESLFVLHEIPFTNVYLVAKYPSKLDTILPISLKTCNSTCAQSPEPPCSVASTTGCTDRENNLRKRFNEMPSCFPTDYSPDNKAKKVCRRLEESKACFKPDGNENCKLWEPKCI